MAPDWHHNPVVSVSQVVPPGPARRLGFRVPADGWGVGAHVEATATISAAGADTVGRPRYPGFRYDPLASECMSADNTERLQGDGSWATIPMVVEG